MRFQKVFFWIVCILIAIPLKSIGSDYKSLIDSVYSIEDIESAISMMKKLKEQDHPVISSNDAPYFYYKWADLYYYSDQAEPAIEMFHKVISHDKVHDSLIFHSNIAIAILYYHIGFYNLSNKFNSACLEIIEKTGCCANHIKSVYNKFATNHNRLGNTNLSIFYYKKALAEAIKINDKEYVSIVYNNIGNLYIDTEQYDSAIVVLNKAEQNIPVEYEYQIYLNKAKAYALQGNFKKSFPEIEKIKIEDIKRFPWVACEIDLIRARNHIRNNAKGKAILTLENVGEMLENVESYGDKADFAEIVSQLYSEIGLFEEALKFYKLFNSFEKTNDQNTSDIKFQELSYQIELEKKNNELEILKKEKNIEKKQKNILLLIILLICLIAAGVIYFFLNKIKSSNKKRIAIKEEVEKQKRRLASFTGFMVVKNENLIKIQEYLEKNSEKLDSSEYSELIREISKNINLEKDWSDFVKNFEEIHPDFFKKLITLSPEITNKDLRHCAFIKMNLTTKEIAILMNITTRGVEKARSRLRAKLGIDQNTDFFEYLTNLD